MAWSTSPCWRGFGRVAWWLGWADCWRSCRRVPIAVDAMAPGKTSDEERPRRSPHSPTTMAEGARRRSRSVRIAALVVVLLGCGLAVVAATRPSFEAAVAKSALLGKPAPAIDAPTLTGAHFNLATERGHWVVVNFFSSWCVPCQDEAPDLVQFQWQQSQQAGGASLVSVVFNDTVAGARSFVATYGTTWPAVVDAQGQIAAHYGVTSPPTTFILNPAGVVEANLLGPVTARQLDHELTLLGASS